MEADLAAESQVRIISEMTGFLLFHFVKQGGWNFIAELASQISKRLQHVK
jgi:hypothetical protein